MCLVHPTHRFIFYNMSFVAYGYNGADAIPLKTPVLGSWIRQFLDYVVRALSTRYPGISYLLMGDHDGGFVVFKLEESSAMFRIEIAASQDQDGNLITGLSLNKGLMTSSSVDVKKNGMSREFVSDFQNAASEFADTRLTEPNGSNRIDIGVRIAQEDVDKFVDYLVTKLQEVFGETAVKKFRKFPGQGISIHYVASAYLYLAGLHSFDEGAEALYVGSESSIRLARQGLSRQFAELVSKIAEEFVYDTSHTKTCTNCGQQVRKASIVEYEN